MRTSYSALDTFQQCPQKFKFQIIDKIKAPKTVETVFGVSVHSALAFMFSKNPLFPTMDEILAHFEETWSTESQKISPVLTPEHRKTYEEHGRLLIKNFYKKNPPWNFSPVDIESHFEVLLPDPETGKTHTIAGIIDRIDKIGDGEYEIIDYKTNRKIPAQSVVDQNLQLSLYHMALVRKWPNIKPEQITVSLYFLKHGEKLSSHRDIAAITATKEAVLQTLRTIETHTTQNNFPPMPSPLCDFCPYKQICPAWRHLYKKDAPSIDETQLEQALQEYFSIKEMDNKNAVRIKELQRVVKAYMDTHQVDRVFDARGYYIAKRLQQRFGYNFDHIKEILVSAGLQKEWDMILEADEKKLKILMNSLPYPIRQKIEQEKILTKQFTTLAASSKPAKK